MLHAVSLRWLWLPWGMAQVMAGRVCAQCGGSPLRAEEKALTQKRRPKFGLGWLLFTVFTAGIGFFVWLVWPRHRETVSVDRWLTCTVCGARQP